MHTIIKIAVVSVLSLFAIVGLVSISKAGEMDGKNFWCIDKTSEFGEGRAYWAQFYKGKGAITIPKAGYDSGKSKLCRNLKVKTDIGWIERIYLDTFDLYWMAEIDNSEWPTSKIRNVKLTMAKKNDALFNGGWILNHMSAPTKKSRSEHNQNNKKTNTKLKKK